MSPDHAHLDAETLAAWMDGGLDASSSAAAEAHVSNCQRCQAVVATFVRTEPATPARAPGALRLWRWWLAPVAATATAVTIWMMMPPQMPEPVAVREQAAELKAEAPPPSAPAESASARAPSASARAPSGELRRDRLLPNQNQDQAAAAPTDRVAKLEAAPRAADTASKPTAAESPRAEAPPRAVAEADAAFTRPPPPPAPASPMRAPVAAPAPVVEQRLGPLEIVSPSPAFRWRIDARGSIERSEDGGRAWFPIRLGTGESITAGSAPSQNICWLVGRRGVVLIAVDGVSFVRLPFPHDVDLVTVAATDGRTATVTAANGRSFTTTDSGRSWK